MNKRTLFVVQAAVIAALYAALFYAQNLILPGTASADIQVRVAEIMCIFAIWTPAAIPGLTIGCILSNLTSFGSMPLDVVIGTSATLLAAICAYALRKIRIKGYPLPSLFMPVIFNAVIVGWEITYFFIDEPFSLKGFLINGAFVGIGEIISVMILGGILFIIFEKKGIPEKILNPKNNR